MTWSRTWPCWPTSTRPLCFTTCADATLPGWSMWVSHYGLMVLHQGAWLPGLYYTVELSAGAMSTCQQLSVWNCTGTVAQLYCRWCKSSLINLVLFSCCLRPTPGSSVWPWIHTNGFLSTQPLWSLPTRANVAPSHRHTSTPSQTVLTMTCCAVSAHTH